MRLHLFVGLDVVREQEIVIANIESAAADDGMGPGRTFPTRGKTKLADRFVPFGGGFD